MAFPNYFNEGLRQYGLRNVGCYPRNRWEFQAILNGKAYPFDLAGQPIAPGLGMLWVFAPSLAHGWTAPSDDTSDIFVMQFDDVPGEIRQAASGQGWLAIKLNAEDRKYLRAMRNQLRSHYQQPNTHSSLMFEQALLWLSVLALRKTPAQPLTETETSAERRAKAALAWYEDNLQHRPSVSDLARSFYVSTSHLRRLFHQAGLGAPQLAMQTCRVTRARALLEQSDFTIERIAYLSGFSSPAVMVRTFHERVGQTPGQWRTFR